MESRNASLSTGALLKWVRIQKEMTIATVSKGTGLSLQYIGELERGEKQPSEAAVSTLASFLQIQVNLNPEEAENGNRRLKQFLDRIAVFDLSGIHAEMDDREYSSAFLYDMLRYEITQVFLKNDRSEYRMVEKILGRYYEKSDGLMSASWYFLKSLYYRNKNNAKAIESARQSLEINGNAKAFFTANYAVLLADCGRLSMSLRESKHAMELAQQAGFFDFILLTEMNRAITMVRFRHYEEGIELLNDCLEKATMNHNSDVARKCRINIVYAFLLDNRITDGYQYALHCLPADSSVLLFARYLNELYAYGKKNDPGKLIEGDLRQLYEQMLKITKKPDPETMWKTMDRLSHDEISEVLYADYCIHICRQNGDFETAFGLLERITDYHSCS